MIFQTKCIIPSALCIFFLLNINVSNSLSQSKEVEQQQLQQYEKHRQSGEIVQDIKLHRFVEAAQKLKQADNDTYSSTVKRVYNEQIGNVALLRDFWHSIDDAEIKNNVYQALIHEVKVHNLVDGQSLSTWSIFGDEIPNLIVESIQKDGPVIHLAPVKCFQCMVDISEKVIKKLWRTTLPMIELIDKARNKLQNVEEQIAFQIATFHEIESKDALNTDNSIILARNMKLTTENADYNSVSSELKSQHEAIKNQLPPSVKNLIFSSKVCMKYTMDNLYLCAGNDSDDNYLDTTVRYTFGGKPQNGMNLPECKWHVSFHTSDVIYIRNVRFETSYLALYSKGVLWYDEIGYAVVAHGPPDLSGQWSVDVYGKSYIKISNLGTLHGKKENGKDHLVYNVTATYNKYNFLYQIDDCS